MRGQTQEGIKKNLDRLARQGGFTFAIEVGRFLVRLAKAAIIARLLGPTNRGVFGLLAVVPEMIVAFGNLGFGPAILYYVAKERYDLKKVTGGAVIFSVLMGSLLLVIGIVMLQLDFIYKGNAQIVRNYSALILISIPILLVERLAFKFLMAKSKILLLNIFGLLQSILPLFFFIAFWLLMANALDAAAWSWFLTVILGALLPSIMMRHEGAYPPRFGTDFLKKGCTYGISGYFAQCFQMSLLRADFFFISAMLGAKELGYYVVATRIAEILLMLPQSVAVPFVPILFGMESKEYRAFTPMVTKIIFIIMALSCLVVILMGRLFIGIVFGTDFLPAYPSLALLLPGIIAFGLYPFFKFDLFGHNMQGMVSALTGIGLLVNLVLNYVMIPIWGIEGAAFSSSIAYILSTVLLLLFYCRVTGNGLLRVLLLTRGDFLNIYARLKPRIG